jgi:hypothetical protein
VINGIENEGWALADWAAELLSADREACRRAFYREPEERVRGVVGWILSERDLSEQDPGELIERWAHEHDAGIHSRNRRRRGSLERVDGILVRTLLGQDEAA